VADNQGDPPNRARAAVIDSVAVPAGTAPTAAVPARDRRPPLRAVLPRRLGLALALLVLLGLTAFGAWVAGINLWAGYHFRAARHAIDHYHDTEAIAHLEACLTVWPHDPETLLLAARAARRLGDFARAESFQIQYRDACGVEDNDLMLEDLLLLAQRGEVDTVRRSCRTLVEDDHPQAPLVLEAMTNGYLRQFRLRDALACLDEWLKRQPDNPQALFLKGRVYDQGLNLSEARASYRRALQLDPERDDARLYLAGKLLDLVQAAEALPHLKYLRKRLPNNPLVPVLLARCCKLLRQPEEAERILDEMLSRFPNDSLALAERGGLALDRGRPKDAVAWLRRAAEQGPGNYEAHYRLFQALTQTGQIDAARKIEERLRQMKHDIDRIQEIVTRKMQEAPHDPALHYEAGTIALRAGAVDEGLRWLQSALKEDPQYLPAHRALAEFYERVGHTGHAARHRRALEAARQAPDQKRNGN
jgi:tetratricopeptide (TPR) repeat protein